jgi:hypothetical protein
MIHNLPGAIARLSDEVATACYLTGYPKAGAMQGNG